MLFLFPKEEPCGSDTFAEVVPTGFDLILARSEFLPPLVNHDGFGVGVAFAGTGCELSFNFEPEERVLFEIDGRVDVAVLGVGTLGVLLQYHLCPFLS